MVRTFVVVAFLIFIGLGAGGCREETAMEKAANKLEEVAEDTADAAEDAADAAEELAEEAAEEAEKKFN